jgi:hypothetical protein
MSPLETFAWAILTFEGFKPGSMSWRHRNPGNLRKSKQAYATQHGYAVFDSFEKGWGALLSDISAKFRGAPYTTSGLGPDSTILEFFEKYAPSTDNNHPQTYAKFVAGFLTQGLQRPIEVGTTLREIQNPELESDGPIELVGES